MDLDAQANNQTDTMASPGASPLGLGATPDAEPAEPGQAEKIVRQAVGVPSLGVWTEELYPRIGYRGGAKQVGIDGMAGYHVALSSITGRTCSRSGTQATRHGRRMSFQL